MNLEKPWKLLKSWARSLKEDVIALWIAARDNRTPLLAKILAGVTAAYALSPIDLIPDFIPILGYFDDIIIVPAGIWCTVKLIPQSLMQEFRASANVKGSRPKSILAAVVIATIWTLILFWVAYLISTI